MTYQEILGEIRELAKNKNGLSREYRNLLIAKRITEIEQRYKEIIDIRTTLLRDLEQNNKYYQLLKERRECQRIARKKATSDRIYTLALQRIKQINKIIKEMKQNNDIRTIYNYEARINRINRLNREIKKLLRQLQENYLFGIKKIIMKHRKTTEHIEAKEMKMSITEYREYEKLRKIKIEWMKEKIAKLEHHRIFYIYRFVYQKQQKTETNRKQKTETKQQINIAKIKNLAKMYI